MTDEQPGARFDPNEAFARRRDELARAIADADEAIRLERRRLTASGGLPVPGTPGQVRPSPVGGRDDAGAEAERRLRELLERRDRLGEALRTHELREVTPAQCEKAAVAWLNQVETPRQLLDELVPDPVFGPLPPRPVRGPRPPRERLLKIATAILRFRERQPERRIRRLADLRGVASVDVTLLRHILRTGCTMVEDPVPPDLRPRVTVGVLLPVRLETRFDPGRVRVRVVPDEPWFSRHDPRVSEGEVAALDRYLAAVAGAPDDAARMQAWRELVAHVGGARAVFLVRTLVVTDATGAPAVRALAADEVREEPAFPRIEGFPDTLQVWLARGGAPPAPVLTLTVDRARLLADFPDPDVAGDHRWWEDWDEAVAVGVAGEIALEDDSEDIDALYVTGLGDADAATLFAGHGAEGRLALLAPGTPTNTVDGAPAAPLGDDPDTWWEVLQAPPSDTDRLVSASLTGDPDRLGNLPGSSEPQREWSAALVAALWPALWGFAGEDVWGIPEGTNAAAAWAPHALFPDGPLPTLRVGSQPYGLLPATALGRWQRDPKDPPVEEAMRSAVLELRDVYRAAAVARGTAVGASTEQLLDLIGQLPTSPLFRHRRAWPLELWWFVLLLLGFGPGWDELDHSWRERHRLVEDLGLDPARRYGAVAAPRRLAIPLVIPEELPEDRTAGEVIRQLIDLAFEAPRLFANTEILELEFLGFPSDSLLFRLVIRALQVAIGDIGRALAGDAPPDPEPVVRDAAGTGRLEGWIEGTSSGALHDAIPETARFRRVVDALERVADIIDADPVRLERLLRATVDTAAYRIDPWLVGPPTRRLQTLLDQKAAAFKLGVFGWVDQPRPGAPGPTAAGLLHAPSPGQAVTATVLRDRAVNDAAARWDLDLTSRSVRDADRIAEHVRVGAHLSEALGREVERIVRDPARIASLRASFPVRTEHEGRRVCDGLAVLAAPPSSLGLSSEQLADLDRLREAVDGYGDLLVAEAVHHVTEGRAEVAGAAMDAAAGLSRPPHLGLLRTPREGRAVTTSAVLVLRDVAEPPLPAVPLERAEVSPASLADAAAATFVQEQTGDPADWTFEVDAVDPTGTPVGAPTTVTIADLGLLPADALSLSRSDLERLAADAGARTLGVGAGDVVPVGGQAGERYERGARLVALVGRRPAGPDAVTARADAPVDPAPVDADLLARYTLVRDTAIVLAQLLTDQLALTASDGGIGTADPAVLTRLVVAARSWGIAPDPAPDVTATATGPADAAERLLVATADRALELLAPRLASAPDTTSGDPTQPAPAAALSRDDLVAALAALVSPTGQLAITSRLTRASLPSLTRDAALERDWLPVVAAVRDSIARIEVHQLAVAASLSGGALNAWTNKPGDPWQQDPTDTDRMIVAYAAPSLNLAALPASGLVAMATVDRFAEVIPTEDQTTGAAFGFDAPAARAPQAILLAVPPDVSTPMDDETVRDVVVETRELARARMARPVDLGPALRGMLPASLLPAAGPTAVPLEPRRR